MTPFWFGIVIGASAGASFVLVTFALLREATRRPPLTHQTTVLHVAPRRRGPTRVHCGFCQDAPSTFLCTRCAPFRAPVREVSR
jgi:hypothetical protein